jgi:hypothetical protein
MDLNGLRDALKKQPFEPFTIRLADGRSLPVPHSEFVAVGPRLVIVVGQDNSWSVVEPLLIVSLDYAANENGDKPGGKRGKRGKKRRRQ